MEYFKKNDLLKLHKNKKTLIGGYKINTDNDDINDDMNDDMNDLFIPGFFYKINHTDSISNTILNYTDVVNESLHNRLLGLLNSNNLTKKNRSNNLKKTRRKRH